MSIPFGINDRYIGRMIIYNFHDSSIPINMDFIISINVNPPYRVLPAIKIWTTRLLLLCQRIHPIPQTRDRVHVPCTVIVQACFLIELFAIELVR